MTQYKRVIKELKDFGFEVTEDHKGIYSDFVFIKKDTESISVPYIYFRNHKINILNIDFDAKGLYIAIDKKGRK